MKKHSIFYFTILACCFWLIKPIIAQADGNFGWLAVYEADAEGKVIYGSLDKLVAAIEDGADVKIQDIDIDHQAKVTIACQNVYLLDDSKFNPMVGCMNTTLLGINWAPTRQTGAYWRFHDFSSANYPYHWYVIYNSNGTVSVIQHAVGGVIKDAAASTIHSHLKWFVRTK